MPQYYKAPAAKPGAFCDGDVYLFVRSFARLSVCRLHETLRPRQPPPTGVQCVLFHVHVKNSPSLLAATAYSWRHTSPGGSKQRIYA